MHITDEGVFILLDNNEAEVKMPVLCKALYILFLLNEDGIMLDKLKDHRAHLFSIYKMISNYNDDKELWRSKIGRAHV